MDLLNSKGSCAVAQFVGRNIQIKITHLSEPIDVYSDWIDACAEINKKDVEGINE